MHGTPISADGLISVDDRGGLILSWRERGSSDHITSTHCEDLRGHTCYICGRGWEFNGPSFMNHKSMDNPFATRRHVHKTCYDKHATLREASDLYALLCESPLLFGGIEEIPNEYWPDAHHYPKDSWFKVPLVISREREGELEKGQERRVTIVHGVFIKCGWRKRVFNMELHYPPGHKFRPDDIKGTLLETSDSTKHFQDQSLLIHAWPSIGDEQRRLVLHAFASVIKRHFPEALFRKEVKLPEDEGVMTTALA